MSRLRASCGRATIPPGRRRGYSTKRTATPGVAPALSAEILILHALRGPRDDWLADVAALAETVWTVSSRSDRVGLRLEGKPLQRHATRSGMELPSEGVVRGAIQVPTGGEPVIFMADHPVTGGYPVVAVLVDDDTDRAAQSVPGQQIRIVLAE